MTAPRLVTYGRRTTPGTVNEQLCSIHTTAVVVGYEGDAGARGRPVIGQPYRFVAQFFDESGRGQCDRCVVDQLRSGRVDVANAADLLAARPAPVLYTSEDGETRDIRLSSEPVGVVEARDVLAQGLWGCEVSDWLDRAVEAKRRNGTLPEFAARLLDVALEPAAS